MACVTAHWHRCGRVRPRAGAEARQCLICMYPAPQLQPPRSTALFAACSYVQKLDDEMKQQAQVRRAARGRSRGTSSVGLRRRSKLRGGVGAKAEQCPVPAGTARACCNIAVRVVPRCNACCSVAPCVAPCVATRCSWCRPALHASAAYRPRDVLNARRAAVPHCRAPTDWATCSASAAAAFAFRCRVPTAASPRRDAASTTL